MLKEGKEGGKEKILSYLRSFKINRDGKGKYQSVFSGGDCRVPYR